MKVLILTESTGSEATRSFVKAFEGRGHKVTIVQPSDLSLFVSSNETGFDRTYRLNNGVIGRVTAKEFDVV